MRGGFEKKLTDYEMNNTPTLKRSRVMNGNAQLSESMNQLKI